MPKIVRSARGELVNFDLIKIKQQLTAAPAPTEVRDRENFVERRLKRKLKSRAIQQVVPEAIAPVVPVAPIVIVPEVKPAVEAAKPVEAKIETKEQVKSNA